MAEWFNVAALLIMFREALEAGKRTINQRTDSLALDS